MARVRCHVAVFQNSTPHRHDTAISSHLGENWKVRTLDALVRIATRSRLASRWTKRQGVNEGNKASHRPSGEAPLNPAAVRFQSRGPEPSSPFPTTAEPRAPVNTTPFEARQSEMKPAGTASSRGANSGGDVLFVPGETRQRKPSPVRSAKSSPLTPKKTRVAPALVANAPG